MKVLGHRRLGGANMYHNGPLDYLVVRSQDGDDLDAINSLANGVDGLGHRIGAAALVLQQACGVRADHVDAWTDADGDWVIVTDSHDEDVARAAAETVVRLINGEVAPEDAEAAVRVAREAATPNASVRAIVDAARARGIPVVRRSMDHFQLGWGNKQHQIHGLMTDKTSGLGYEIANDNERILEILEDTGIPIPLGESRCTLRGVEELADELRYPLALKPLRGKGGVTPLVEGPDELEAAYDHAKEKHRWVVVEDHVYGAGHQVLVAGGQVVSAVRLPDTDVTDTLHPAVRLVAERAARLCHMDRVGVDIVADDLEHPLDETRGKVVSLDPEPELAIHRDITGAVLDDLFDDDGRIPLVAVTGTNGKTTTVRLISHILKYAGGRVGMACTGAVEVENQVILEGDYSGPTAARTVLQEPGISHAVCEVARGGILRRGLGFDRCDVSVFLNVASDHLGQGGIETVDDLARLKGVVVKATSPSGAAILNADDPRVWAMRGPGRVIPFTLDAAHPDIDAHLAASPENVAVVLEDRTIVLRRGTARFTVCDVMDIPITLNGAARFNIQNAMAAIGAAFALGLSEDDTRAGLITFNPSTGQLPGRMNLMDLGGVRVLLDYGHNVPALKALADVLPRLAPGRKINVANASGNRRDEDLLAFGGQIATMYDRIYLCDPDPRRRGTGETAAVIETGIKNAGYPDGSLIVELDEGKALRMALADSKPGDLLVLQADDVKAAIALMHDLQARLDAGESPRDLNDFLMAA